ncbi:MAG: zinc-binding dehydrogenase [Bacteroidales bacterium]|nr:zinc-binding dehydrogenase [Bacteroidales bacterium]
MLETSMKAVVLTKPCKAEEMALTEIPVPAVRPGWVLIKVKAFGINHSEVLLRQFEVAQDYIRKPVVPGIECVGEIINPSDSGLAKGQRVIALMGGMGRSFNGSYAEYALLPESHVFPIESKLDWDELAAIPETFYTAYGSLRLSLQLGSDDTLLIRGGTSTVGIAALQLAKAMGATVISTTRSEKKAELLRGCGADDVILEGADFRKRFLEKYPAGATKVLELIGASTLYESLRLTVTHGIVCHTGLLGGVYGLKNFDPIKDIPSGVYLTGFYSNNPTKYQIDDMMSIIERGGIHPVIAGKFTLADISKAHLLAEQRGQIGKIVVINEE